LAPAAKPFFRPGADFFPALRRAVLGPLPKTLTGKIQKFILRHAAGSAGAIAIV
jgi:hypothetical protein